MAPAKPGTTRWPACIHEADSLPAPSSRVAAPPSCPPDSLEDHAPQRGLTERRRQRIEQGGGTLPRPAGLRGPLDGGPFRARRCPHGRKHGRFSSPSTDADRLAVYCAVRDAPFVPDDASFFLVACILDMLTDENAEQAVHDHEEHLKEIRRRHGLEERSPCHRTHADRVPRGHAAPARCLAHRQNRSVWAEPEVWPPAAH
jgi:hypothetical protein